MGHITGKNIYRKLGEKIDNLTIRAPWNEALYKIFKTLYSEEEADVVSKMPYSLSKFDRVQKITKYEKTKLRKILDNLCSKGLVVDMWLNEDYYYMPAPMVIGIFEFTMMRTGGNLDSALWAQLFNDYLHGDDSFYAANAQNGEKISVMRAIPHEGTVEDYMEVLDYEKATSIVESANKFSIALCSCRHEKLHIGKKECGDEVPLSTCSTFGMAADYLIRNNIAKEVSKSEMLENIARSKELGLVFNADNIKKNVTFICHCCKCCCNALLGISKFGYPNMVVTSNYIAKVKEAICVGCGKCAHACPISAIEMVQDSSNPKKKKAVIDASVCLGCGVCALSCKTKALKLDKRNQRVLHPETTFERVILQSLERGTLHNQIFDNPENIGQKVMSGIVGGFLKLPSVKKALMSDTLRSRFLKSMEFGLKLQGKGWMAKL
ncbi:MAG: 4Fe-4S dicluster domain-containing protein [Desulfobacterales bacterium]|nr:4Fe-4S dicluster domain-containing protein [Desulfobacterales bacterium]